MAHTHPVIDGDNHFIIDPITRAVTNAESKKTILMQNDHNSERFTFEIDKTVEGHDMTKCNKVEVHYTNEDSNKKNKNAGVYEVTDMQVSADNGDKLIFSWLVSENATLYAGSLRFLIVFSCVEKGEVTYRWNTNVNTSISISKGMNNGEAIEEAYPDILTQWKAELFAAIYGMETTHVGPTEPETYPYIWFDTSQYIGSSDPYIGVITIKDADGNKHVLYPFAKLAGTDGADLEAKFDAQAEQISELVEADAKHQELINDLSAKIDDVKTDIDESITEDLSELSSVVASKATTALYTGTLSVSGWSSSTPYTQSITVSGILATDNPFVDVDMSGVSTSDGGTNLIDGWALVGRVTASGNNTITAVCYEDKPDLDIPILLKVVR